MTGYVTGIDGGGSGCRGRVIAPDGQVFNAISDRPANVQSDFAGAIAAVSGLLQDLAAAAGYTLFALKSGRIHLGLAGVMDDGVAARTARALALRPDQISEDQPTMLRGALGGRDGILAAIGTGSFLAMQSAARTQYLGGHGVVLGDQASGAWLGRDALRRALLMHDGLHDPTPLGQRILAHFATPHKMICFAANAAPADFAKFAPWILEAAQAGDTMAIDLLTLAGRYVAQGADILAGGASLDLCLTGGVGPHLVPYLPAKWQSRVIAAQGDALDGAVDLAYAQTVPAPRTSVNSAAGRYALHADQLFDGQTLWGPRAVVIDGGRIAQITAPDDLPPDLPSTPMGGILMPGFVDLQVNGGGGVMIDGSLTAEGLQQICAAHRQLGALQILPTLITDTPDVQAHVADLVIAGCNSGLPLLGLHFEGPHLDPIRAGAHDPALIRPMTDQDLAFYTRLRASLPSLMITIAPENCTLDQTRALTGAGVCVALGHSNTDYATAMAYFDAGAQAATHLFNAMSGLSHRAPGLVGAALASQAMVGVIADLHHVAPAALQLALHAKQPLGQVYAVSDCMAVAGTQATEFELNGRKILRRDGRLTLADGTLAGADLDMSQALRNLCHRLNVPLLQALRMVTQTPSRLMGRDDIGQIRVGAPADLLHLDTQLQLRHVWQNGQRI